MLGQVPRNFPTIWSIKSFVILQTVARLALGRTTAEIFASVNAGADCRMMFVFMGMFLW